LSLPAVPSISYVEFVKGDAFLVRCFGLDVHLDFCEVAVAEGGRVSRVGRIASTPAAIREFAVGLNGSDEVVLEASCGAMMIARLLEEGSVGRVVVCNAAETRAISRACEVRSL
jgi:transposase